jgi:hypothetical protein
MQRCYECVAQPECRTFSRCERQYVSSPVMAFVLVFVYCTPLGKLVVVW